MMERKVLGKGLEALIPKRPQEQFKKEFTYLPLIKIRLGKYQPRQELDPKELEMLSQSIKEKGVIQPIVVRRRGEGEFEIVVGARRYQAAKLLGINEIPAVIKELDDKDALMFAIIENLQRKDLNPIEEALAFKRLIEEFGFTQEEVGNFLGKDKSSIANTLRLLRLPQDIQDALRKGIIARTQARAILSLDKEKDQRELFNKILKEGLSVRELERRVRKVSKRSRPQDPFVSDMEDRFQKFLGTKVRILNKRNNRGKIIIEYYSLEDLDRIAKKLL